MKLSVFPRPAKAKSELTRIRLEGNIPAVLYGEGQVLKHLTICGEDVQTILRHIKQGQLSTTVFEIHDGSTTHKVIVKEVQYHPSTYAILHMDLLEVKDHIPVQVNVPIQLANQVDCVGVKLGGFVRQVIRSLKVSCLLKDLPSEFVLDIKDLGVSQSLRLGDIPLPQGVKPIGKMGEIAVLIAKKA